MTIVTDVESDELQRRKDLWLAHSKRHQVVEPTGDCFKSRNAAPAAPKPVDRADLLDRRLCTKCGRRGDLEPVVTVSPCCRAPVLVTDYRGQVRLRERLWSGTFFTLRKPPTTKKLSKKTKKAQRSWRKQNAKLAKKARAGKFGLGG